MEPINTGAMKAWLKQGTGSRHELAHQLTRALDEIDRLRQTVHSQRKQFDPFNLPYCPSLTSGNTKEPLSDE